MSDLERYGDDDGDDDDVVAPNDMFGGALGNALAQAQAMQTQEVDGTAGGGAVRIIMNGAMEFHRVFLRPDIVDSSDIEMLEDLVLAALNDAAAQLRANQAKIQQQMLSGLGGLGDAGGLGGLGKLFGGG